MLCPACHSPNSDDRSDCSRCGARLEDNFPTVSAALRPGAHASAAQADLSPPAGTLLANRYVLLERIGAGGMGVVYKARDQRLERLVALKILTSRTIPHSEQGARFLREARAAAALDHPNICTVYEIDEVEGHAFIAMAHLTGQSLKQKAAGTGVSVPEALNYAMQAASALAYAHARGVVHRDIKPGNLFITTDGTVKIIDFGLATVAGEETLTVGETLLGTPAYMSPEQANADKVDHRADIWSLGAVLYEMITGQVPFPGPHMMAILYGVVNKDYEPVRKLRPTAPPAIESILANALAKSREQRYASMREFLEDLRGVAESLGLPTASAAPHGSGYVSSVAVIAPPASHGSRSISGSGPSIAVLPFVDMSSGRDQEYLCEGVAEDVINALMQVPGLHVVSRGSSFRFGGRSYDLAEVSRKLRVSTVLEGSVRRHENRLRISVHLIDAASGAHLWSHRYDRELKDIFAVQDEISQSIAGALRVKLVDEQHQNLAIRATGDMEAYSAYLKGRFFWSKRTADAVGKAVEFYQEALRRDPNYAPALAGLADAYILPGYYGTAPPRAVMPKGREAALRALEINPNLAEGRTSLGVISALFEHDWRMSEEQFELALQSNPNYPTAHSWYSVFHLVPRGRFDEALGHMKIAQRLDPLTPFVNTIGGMCLYYMGEYDAAAEALQRVVEMDPAFPTAYVYLGHALLDAGRREQSLSAFRTAFDLNPRNPYFAAHLGQGYAMAGHQAEAEHLLADLAAREASSYIPAFSRVMVELGLGHYKAALDDLERAYEEREMYCVWLAVDRYYDPIRSDPRFQRIVQKVGV